MEHERATLAQIREGKGGRFFEVEDAVFHIVEEIGQIDENLRVNPKAGGSYFEIAEVCKDGKEREVTTAQELDSRLVEHLRRMSKRGWDAGREMEKHEEDRVRAVDHAFHEEVGER